MTSARIPTRLGQVPNLQPITLGAEGLTVQQLNAITAAIQDLTRAVNGHITFGDSTQSSWSGNIDGHTKSVYFAAAFTDYEVPHGLGRKPVGIIVLSVDTDDPGGVGPALLGAVRASNEGSWTPTRLFVRCNYAGITARFVVV